MTVEAIKNNLRGKFQGQVGNGVFNSMQALVKNASVTVDGEILLNRHHSAAAAKLWNIDTGYEPVVVLNGVKTGMVVEPNGANNEIKTSAGTIDCNGVKDIAVNADTSVAVVMPATGKYNISAIVASAAGAVTAVLGADGDALDWTAFSGAGQPPLVATNLVILDYVWQYSSVAGLVPAANVMGMPENPLQDYEIDPLRGGVVFSEELPKSHTGNVPRGVYASFYDLTASLQTLTCFEKASIIITRDPAVNVAMGAKLSPRRISTGKKDWKVSVVNNRTGSVFLRRFLNSDRGIRLFKMWEDTADTTSFIGYVALDGSYTITTDKGPQKETLEFPGTGELREV